jgi:hypothetical protein
MGRVIVIEFVSVDGVMHDPDGSEGSRQGGWAFRYGQEAVAGDKFGLGDVLDTGAMLLGRRTWPPRCKSASRHATSSLSAAPASSARWPPMT